MQYHWFNRDYATFDDFLGAMTSRKRKMIRRERKQISQQGITIEIQEGQIYNRQYGSCFIICMSEPTPNATAPAVI